MFLIVHFVLQVILAVINSKLLEQFVRSRAPITIRLETNISLHRDHVVTERYGHPSPETPFRLDYEFCLSVVSDVEIWVTLHKFRAKVVQQEALSEIHVDVDVPGFPWEKPPILDAPENPAPRLCPQPPLLVEIVASQFRLRLSAIIIVGGANIPPYAQCFNFQ